MIAESRRLRGADCALWRDGDLGFDDVLDPVARTGGNIARQGVAGERRDGDIVRAADAAFEHAATPYRNILAGTVGLNFAGAREASNAAEFDIDDAAGAEFNGGLRVTQVGNRFVETESCFDLLLQFGVRVEIVPPQRLFDHQQIKFIQAAQVLEIVQRISGVGIHRKQNVGVGPPDSCDEFTISARFNFELDASVAGSEFGSYFFQKLFWSG